MVVNKQFMMQTATQTALDLDERISMVRTQLYRYCEFLSTSRHEAEDLVQTTLLKALPVLQGEKHHPNIPALLRRIAKNTWIDEVRKHGHYELCAPEELQNIARVAVEDNFDLKEALQVVIQRLTPQQQVVVLLCDVFQYTNQEAAELLGVSHGAVKATLHRARLRLRRLRDTITVIDESQQEILEAYVLAFRTADIRMLVQLCQDGLLDPVYATSRVLTFGQKQPGQATSNDSNQAFLYMAA